MPNATRHPALNIPLLVLWVVSIGVAGLGFWLLQSGNNGQADFYNSQGSDYLQFLNLQTQSTLGGLLLTAGVVGVFIALATHARNRAAAVVAANAVVADELDVYEIEDDELDAEPTVAEPTVAEPAVAEPAAVEAKDASEPEATPAPETAASDLAAPAAADQPETDEPKDSTERA